MRMRSRRSADPQVRVRIFAYLKANGLSVGEANSVARKLVFAMVGNGALPASAAKLAGAAVSKPPPGEAAAGVLVEPTAERYEDSGPSAGKPGAKPVGRPVGGRAFGSPGRPGGVGRPSHGFGRPSGGGFGGRPGGGHRGPITGPGAGTDFAIIEPVMFRREVQAQMSTVLGRGQVRALAAEVARSLKLPM